jgi:hypothetical protein
MRQHESMHAEQIPTGFSNGIQLTGRQWLGVGLFALLMFLFVPSLWKQVEKFDPEPDYRIPHELSNDYWLYDRYTQLATARYDTLLVGDSVIWGEYVTQQQTLSHFLNKLAGEERFANLGLDGAHPVALAGLVEHYASGVTGKKVLLNWNPLWVSSPEADLQDPERPNPNHPRLWPQFVPSIPSYDEKISPRIGIVVEQHVPFSAWNNHLQQAYYQQKDIPSWTLEHPYDNPVKPLTQGLPPTDDRLRHLPLPWNDADPSGFARELLFPTGFGDSTMLLARHSVRMVQYLLRAERNKRDFPWVDLNTSLQWRFFRRTFEVLKQRDNRVFVLVGPFNEYMLLSKNNLQAYHKVKSTVEAWLRENGVPYLAMQLLPSNEYADASHPLSMGYERLARQLFESLPR